MLGSWGHRHHGQLVVLLCHSKRCRSRTGSALARRLLLPLRLLDHFVVLGNLLVHFLESEVESGLVSVGVERRRLAEQH